MSQVYLFQLASQRTHWLSSRQSMIADNVANASTPAFVAKDLQPFSAVLDRTQVSMATTDPAHFAPAAADFGAAQPERSDRANESLSGNSVNLAGEMIKLGDVNHEYSVATGITRIFHQMMMAALK